MNNIITELSKIYSTTKFIRSYRYGDGMIVLYNNEDLEWDEVFINKVTELAQLYLNGSELENFTFLYDYLNEIIY